MKKFLLLGMVLPVLSGCVIKEQTRYVESPVATNFNNPANNQAGAAVIPPFLTGQISRIR
ncbi:hypothetical protein [Enterobacter hormaechei]|uniref:hypothetical protein n=1 Tax=Enterobacter hormaechei TaxID=158836 RepID=UPI003AAD5285